MAKRHRAVNKQREPRRALPLSEDAESAGGPKIAWRGRITSVQPRIRLTRSFDESSHTYLGFGLRVEGRVGGDDNPEFWIGIGKEAQAKHRFEVGVVASGQCCRVADPQMETVAFYKVSAIEVHERPDDAQPPSSAPWHGVPPDLPTYRQRGHRRLAGSTYPGACSSCLWGCRMAVEMIIDKWQPYLREYRTETFCYGPKNCALYKAGPKRTVPGRKGMRWVEEDWVDEGQTSQREEAE